MAFKISGFAASPQEKEATVPAFDEKPQAKIPRRSLVQIRFPGKNMPLTYYNDQFDLTVGDLVYVDGKLEGQLGRVTDISYNFKIKLSNYQKVIALVDTHVQGQFYMAGSHFVTFDPDALPANQVISWFKAPPKEDEETVSSWDDTSFHLDDLSAMRISSAIAERGHNYYLENRVRYICLNGSAGTAIIEGCVNYLVEFEYFNGEICHLTCDCPCSYSCKHSVAAMLQLKETLELIKKHYADIYAQTEYFAAINKSTLFTFAINGKETGTFIL